MPRARERRYKLLAAGVATVGATLAVALLVAGPVSGAGGGSRAGAEAWRAVFGDRPQVSLGRRMIVVLAAPSLADRMASGRLVAATQRQAVREAEVFQRRLLAALRSRGVAIRRERVFTRTLNGFSAVLDAKALAALERAPGVAGVYPVRAVYPAALAAPAGGTADPFVSLPGFDGSGVTVALLDTGIDLAQPALASRALLGIDLLDGDADASAEARPGGASELETHGTRTAGIVARVAPRARLLPIRVVGWQKAADGSFQVFGRSDVLLAGLERAVDPNGDGAVGDAARVALAPLVEPYASFPDSPEARAVAGAATLGTLVVAAAGNDGPAGAGLGTIAAPAGAAAALAVGAADAGLVAGFSSQGPAFDGRVKPDVVAPGVAVPTADAGSAREVAVTGSSAAAAVAAGAAALVAQARPTLDASSLHAVLVASARPLAGSTTAQGAGLVNPAAALGQVVAVEPATLGLDPRAVQTIRVRNLTRHRLGTSLDLAGSPALSADRARLVLGPGASAVVRLRLAASPGGGAALAGVLVVQPDGAPAARIPWAAVPSPSGRLLGRVELSRRAFAPSRSDPAVLTFQAGRVGERAAGLAIEPVALLDVDLWTAGGRRLGTLVRLRDLLPGRYAVGLTGRGPDGRLLPPGRYVVRLRAYPVAAAEGAGGSASTAAVAFTVRRPGAR